MHLFCFGYGYVARRLADVVRARGGVVSGTSRSAGNRFTLDDDTPLSAAGLEALDEATHILISIPPAANGIDAAFRHHAAQLQGKRWIGYLSTTGVYGDRLGEWVDETAPLQATEPRSMWRIEAEREWLGLGAHIFRLAGIYGPGRNALDTIRAGTAQRIDKPGLVFSRVHVDDIVQALLTSMAAPQPGEIYNLCDDEPAPSHEVVAHGCRLLGVEPPPLVPFEQAQLNPMAQSFYRANRRVRNDKMKEKLGVRLQYPTYREGLASILHDEEEMKL